MAFPRHGSWERLALSPNCKPYSTFEPLNTLDEQSYSSKPATWKTLGVISAFPYIGLWILWIFKIGGSHQLVERKLRESP